MPCDPEDEYPPPTKKIRHISPNPRCVFSVDEVDRICSSSKEKCELEVLTRELDSLDEDAVFVRMRHCLGTGVPQPLGPTFAPLPGLCSFAKRDSVDNFIYLPPKKITLDCSPEPSEVVTTVLHSEIDTARPEIALGARLEASVFQKVAQQKHQGLWSASRLPKVMEPKQDSCQHEYLMGDILWLSTDFAEERKWKKEVAYRLAKSAQTYLLLRQEWNRQCRIAEERIRWRNATLIAKMVKQWWLEVKNPLLTEVDLLLSDAALPLDKVVSPGYLDQRAFLDDGSSSGQISADVELFDVDVPSSSGTDSDLSEAHSELTPVSHPERLFELKSVVPMQSTKAVPPRDRRQCSESPYHPMDLHETAMNLNPLLRSYSLWSEKSLSALSTTGWNPAFRIRTLPSQNLGCAVTWLRQAFLRAVPGLLLCPSPISGDAELAVAAHLGQLTIDVQDSHLSRPDSPGSKNSGNWGPHLIVTSHISLSSWRSRLLAWCPGLKLICLSLGGKSVSSRKGRRLRACIAHGTVNICLTTYSALRARPNRYREIQWSVIVFDHVHCLINHMCRKVVGVAEAKAQRTRVAVKTENVTKSSTNGSFCSLITETNTNKHRKASSIIERNSGSPLDLFTSELKCSGHRILISSVPDLCPSLCGYRLYLLSRLLLLRDPVGSSAYHSWVSELFQATTTLQRKSAQRSTELERPTKRQLLKFMEPFIVRLDEDDEWETLVDEEIVCCPMTATQGQLHDAVLMSKSARNALKSGDLLDLLRTVSLASRICSHPCLNSAQPRTSPRFQNVLEDLDTAALPFGPFIFRIPSKGVIHSDSELLYDTPESVVRAVQSLREFDWSSSVFIHLNLHRLMHQPRYIRDRVADLVPTADHFSTVFNPAEARCAVSGIQTRPRAPPVLLDGHNGVNRRGLSAQPMDDGRNNEFFRYIRSKLSSHLSNGIPEQMDIIDGRDAVKQLDFANILIKSKRPRSVSGLPLPESIPQAAKRRRVEHRPQDFKSPPKRINGSTRGNSMTNASPFLSGELLVQLEKEMANSSLSHSYSKLKSFPKRSSGDSRLNERVSDSSAASVHSVDGHANATPTVLHLTERNRWKCIQSAGISDWCSAASCAFLQFDPRFLRVAQTRSVPSPGHSLTVIEYLQLQLIHELGIWNLPSLYMSRLPLHSLLCSRPIVVAEVPWSTVPSRYPPDCNTISHSCTTDDYVGRASSESELRSNLAAQPSPLCLSCAVSSLYQFSERSRWLSTPQTFPSSYGCFNHWAWLNTVGLTPCSRLFIDSGKFLRLHQLLSSLLGTQSNTSHGRDRLRCVYLLAHQSALLDLLEGFLAASSWRSYPRIRLPCSEDLQGVRSAFLIDRINHWPCGCCSPMIVLLHSRSSPGFLSGLRAGPDTGVIVCDMDWRADTSDALRFLFHSWALNGLVDMPKSNTCAAVSRPVLRIYRLVSNMPANSLSASTSMEECLSRGVACRLLPRAVFHAHSVNSEGASLSLARVQPNVVNELLSCSPSSRSDESQNIVVKAISKVTDIEKDLSCMIKPEAPSYSSSSSVASSFSMNASGPQRGSRSRVCDDEPSGFREREPLSEELLNSAFELFEDSSDVLAWSLGLTESNLHIEEFTDEYPPVSGIDCDRQSLSPGEFDDFGYCFMDIRADQTHSDVVLPDPQSLEQQLGYSGFDKWEVAHCEVREYLSSLEDQMSSDSSVLLTYNSFQTELPAVFEGEPGELFGFTAPTPSQLFVWEPFLSADSTKVLRFQNKVDSHLSMVELKAVSSDRKTCHEFPIDFNEIDWGYESEPMTEEELPPITMPVVTPMSSTCIGLSAVGVPLKRSESSVSSSASALNQVDKVGDVVSFSPSTARTPSIGPSLKRRKLFGGSASRRGAMTEQLPPSPSLLDEHVQIHNQGEDSDVSMAPSPCSMTSSRGVAGVREVTASLAGSGIGYGPGFPNSGTSSGIVGNNCNASGTVLTTGHTQSNSTNGATPRLHIPRATYNKEVGSARNNRLRRSNAGSTTNSSVAAVAAMAVGSQVGKSLSYQFQTAAAASLDPFPNSATLARYAHTSPGRSLHHGVSAASPLSSRFGVSQTTTGQPSGQGNSTQSISSGQFHVGKPLEWLPYEEAALYMCITKIQDLLSDASNSLSTVCPNFRLAEFYMNNYVPVRGYRGARQCLLMHSRMLSVVAAATAALSNGAFIFPQSASAVDLFTSDDGGLSGPSLVHSTTAPHGPTGRKVKNKLKSVAAAAAGIAGTISQSGPLSTGATSSSLCGGVADGANALSRYRAYLAYQCLPSSGVPAGAPVAEIPNNLLSDSSVSAPGQLNQLLANLRTSDDSQARIVRKAVLDSLSPAHSMSSSQPYRTAATRRPLSVNLSSSSHLVSLGSTYSTGSGIYSSGNSASGTIYGHHHGSSGSLPVVPLSHVGHAPTAPALLTHHRHHRHQAVHDQTSSSACESSVPPCSLTHTGPIIQKNPTHIAALQEHNINPDTLITPAMVIKNKEEREARLRAEAISASQLNSMPIASVCASGNVSATSTPTSIYHSSHSNIHASDATQSGQLSLQLDPGGSGIVATLPMNLSGSHLSFTHANSQRGTSVMLPIRGGFGTHSLASASTVISFAHVGGSQSQHQRISGCTSSSSVLSSGHQTKQSQQLLAPSLGRLTHFSGSGAIDLMSTGPGTNPTASSGGISATGPDSDGIGVGTSITVPGSASVAVESGSSNVVLPSSWRTSTVSRGFSVQNSRISSLPCNQAPTSTTIPVTGAYLTTQVNKSSVPTSYFLQQRPQFLSTNQSSLPTRNILTSHSGQTGNSTMVLGGNYGSSITSLPHILRPRGTLRGSVIQPAFVRTITATSTAAVSVVPHQSGPRPSFNGNFTHNRISLAVSSSSAPVSHLLNSRATISPGIRTQSTAIFQQLRPANQTASGSGSSPVTFSFSSQLGTGTGAAEGRHYVGQHQSVSVHQTNTTVSGPFSTVSASDSGNAGHKLDADSYITRMQ